MSLFHNVGFSHDLTPLPFKADVHHTDADSMSIKCCPEIPQGLDLGGEEGRDFQKEELVEGRAGRKFNNIMNIYFQEGYTSKLSLPEEKALIEKIKESEGKIYEIVLHTPTIIGETIRIGKELKADEMRIEDVICDDEESVMQEKEQCRKDILSLIEEIEKSECKKRELTHRLITESSDTLEKQALENTIAQECMHQRALLRSINLDKLHIRHAAHTLKWSLEMLKGAQRELMDCITQSSLPLETLDTLFHRLRAHPIEAKIIEQTYNVSKKDLFIYETTIKSAQEKIHSIEAQVGFDREDLRKLVLAIEEEEKNIRYAKERLIKAHLNIVIRVAKKYTHHGIELPDLIQERIIGLIKALDKYCDTRECRFRTYAIWWIRQTITRAVANHARMIKISVPMYNTYLKLLQTSLYLFQKLGREPSVDEIAHFLECPSDEVRKTLCAVVEEPFSMDTLKGEGEDIPLGEHLADRSIPSPEDASIYMNLREILKNKLSVLNPREESIIRMRYGVGEKADHTLEEIGQFFNLTRERIRQIEASAFVKLRSVKRGKELMAFVNR